MTDPAVTNRDGVGEAVAGPFTMRDITVALSVVLLFLASVLPAGVFRGIVFNMWNSGGLFQLGLSILLPVIVLVLFAIRRLAPKTKLRIGSLSVDQFASVVACFNAAYYFLELVSRGHVDRAHRDGIGREVVPDRDGGAPGPVEIPPGQPVAFQVGGDDAQAVDDRHLGRFLQEQDIGAVSRRGCPRGRVLPNVPAEQTESGV